MSWFSDCPFTKEDFEDIEIYLMLLHLRSIQTPNAELSSVDKLEGLIKKLGEWLGNASVQEGKGM